jgi:DNA-binding protein H-NS
MPTYQEYQHQIAELQKLAEQAREGEVAEARKQVLELMQAHGLRVEDLASPKKATPAAKTGTVKAKYRDPDSGQTWTGRGRAPRWLNNRNKDEFLIK